MKSPAKNDHWKKVYDLNFWDLVMDWWVKGVTPVQVKRVIAEAKIPKGARILDVPCGIARHSLELARLGYDVVGLDYSKPYIAKSKENAKRARLSDRVRFERGDMRTMSKIFEPESFDAIVMLGNSFGYFDKRSDDLRVLKEVRKLLKPNGVFILDTLNGRSIENIYLNVLPKSMGLQTLDMFFPTRPGVYAGVNTGYDEKEKRAWAEWSFIDSQRRKLNLKSISYNVNVYSDQEHKALLKRAGLRRVKEWSKNLEGIDYDPQYAFLKTWNIKRS